MKTKIRRQKNFNKGVTLIALVITIIVLLILVGVSITTLTGENGILIKGESATKETEIAEAKEQAKLDIAEWVVEQLEKGKSANITDSIIQEILTGREYVGEVQRQKFTTKKNGYEILYTDLYNNFNTSKTPKIPKGFYVVPGLDNAEEGLVISDIENDIENKGNQFVWIPVMSEGEYVRNKTYVDTAISEKAIDDTNYLPTGVEIPEGKTEGEVEKEMVVKAGGFYIGRYEAGKEGTDTLVCKKGETVWNNITQVNAKEKAKTFINNEQVKSGLLTGIQWDIIMAFISQKPRMDGEGNVYDVTNYFSKRHTGSLARGGQNEADKVCNIYDLEGNCIEYVAERNTWYGDKYPNNVRGGNFAGPNVAASVRGHHINGIFKDLSFRFILYVM